MDFEGDNFRYSTDNFLLRTAYELRLFEDTEMERHKVRNGWGPYWKLGLLQIVYKYLYRNESVIGVMQKKCECNFLMLV